MDEKDRGAQKRLESRRVVYDKAEKVGKGRLPESALPGNLLGKSQVLHYTY